MTRNFAALSIGIICILAALLFPQQLVETIAIRDRSNMLEIEETSVDINPNVTIPEEVTNNQFLLQTGVTTADVEFFISENNSDYYASKGVECESHQQNQECTIQSIILNNSQEAYSSQSGLVSLRNVEEARSRSPIPMFTEGNFVEYTILQNGGRMTHEIRGCFTQPYTCYSSGPLPMENIEDNIDAREAFLNYLLRFQSL